MSDREFYREIIAYQQERIKELKRRLKQAENRMSGKSIAKSHRGFNHRLYSGWIDGRVSVVLPVYNQSMFLTESIESVLSQTYERIELIIVNDGSTDGIETILDRYADHPKVKILTQPNQKLPVALNSGFKIATGEFYTWTSADNIMLPNQIEEHVRFLKMNPDATMVYSDYQIIDEKGEPKHDPTFRPQNQDPLERSIIRLPGAVTVKNYHDSGDNFIGPSFLYRQFVARIVGDYAPDAFGGEDYDYWLRIDLLFSILHLDKVLYRYRVHDQTLNAKAHELNLFANITRVRERDRLRRQFYDTPFRILGVGPGMEDLGSCGSPDSDKTLLLFKLSCGQDRKVREMLSNREVVSVCLVDREVDEFLSEEGVLSESDFILVTGPEEYEVLFPAYGERLLCVREPFLHLDLFLKLAKSKLFKKVFEPSDLSLPAAVYQAPRKLNLALQVDHLDKGGLEQVVHDLATHIDRSRFNISVIVTGRCGMIGERLRSRGVDVFEVKGNHDAYRSVLKERRIDLINTHYSTFGVEIGAGLDIGIVATLHSSYTWLPPEDLEAFKKANPITDRYIAVSRQVKNYFRRRFGISSRKIGVIPNGLNPEDFDSSGEVRYTRAALGYNERDFILLNVGTLNSYVKAHPLMLSAMADLAPYYPEIKLLIVGHLYAEQGKQFYEALVRRIETEGLKGVVKIVDSVERSHLQDLYRMADVFVLPSVQEGCSLSLLEALYFSLPVIVSDVGAARDVVTQNDVGLIIGNPYDDIVDIGPEALLAFGREARPENLKELEMAIADLYENRTAWTEKAKKGREKIIHGFDIKKTAKRYEEEFIRTHYLFKKEDWGQGEVGDGGGRTEGPAEAPAEAPENLPGQDEIMEQLRKEIRTRDENMAEIRRQLSAADAERRDSQNQLWVAQHKLQSVQERLLSIESSHTWKMASGMLKVIQRTPLLRGIVQRIKRPVR